MKSGQSSGKHEPRKQVTDWLLFPPAWLRISEPRASVAAINPRSGQKLQFADVASIELAQSFVGCTLLMDDRAAKQEASARGDFTLGSLVLLFHAGELGLLDSGDALTKLEHTTFRVKPSLRAYYRHQWNNRVGVKP